MLDRECKSLNFQVVMASHSPTLIEYAFEQSQKFRRKFKTVSAEVVDAAFHLHKDLGSFA